MRLDQQLIDYLRNYFVSRQDTSTIGGDLYPNDNEGSSLGAASRRWDTVYTRTVVAENLYGSVASGDADTVDTFHASATPTANYLLALDGTGKFPESAIPDGAGMTAHDVVGAYHTVTGSQWQVVGLTGTDTLGLLTPSSDPGAAQALLMSDSSGFLELAGLGIGAPPVAYQPLKISGTINRAGSWVQSFAVNTTVTDTTTDFAGIMIAPYISPTGGTSETYDGIESRMQFTTDQTLSGWVSAGKFSIYNTSTSGTIANAVHVDAGYVYNPNGSITQRRVVQIRNGAGDITDNYGLYIENQTIGSNYNFSIYSLGGNFYHAGSVGIGIAPPATAKLSVQWNSNGHDGTVYGNHTYIYSSDLSGTGASIMGQYTRTYFQDSTDRTSTWIYGQENSIFHNQTSTLGYAVGNYTRAYLYAAGEITNFYGYVTAQPYTPSGGSVDTMYGFWFRDTGESSTITTIHGVHIGTLDEATTYWGLYTENSGISLGGNIQFRQAASLETTSGNFELTPAGDLVLDPVGNDVLPETGYDINLGSLSKKYLTLHAAELWVETLVAQDTIATIGGRILVGPTTKLTQDINGSTTTIYVEHNEMADGDIVYLEANGKVEFIEINSAPSGTGPYSYTVVRDKDGSGGNDWYAGDAVFNTGQTGDGFIDLYSIDGVYAASATGPTIVGNVRQSATFNDWEERWAIGNLNGVFNNSTVYGVAFGDPDATYIQIDATDGIQIFSTSSHVIGQWDTSGNVTLGEVASSQGHAYWNQSNKRLEFRGGGAGTTVEAYIDTDGSIRAGGGAVRLDTSGVSVYNATTQTLNFATDGDVLIGSNIGSASSTSMAIFTNAQTYNGESMGAGDILIGDNSSGGGGEEWFSNSTPDRFWVIGNEYWPVSTTGSAAANLLWDQSAGQLKFRGGTTTELFIDTDGSLKFAGGDGVLDSDGIYLEVYDDSFNDIAAYKFGQGGTVRGGLYAGDLSESPARNQINLVANEVASYYSQIEILADSPTTYRAQVDIIASGGSNGSSLTLRADDNDTFDSYAFFFHDGDYEDTVQYQHYNVSHGFTGLDLSVNTYGVTGMDDYLAGGFQVTGYRDSGDSRALVLVGRLDGTADTTHNGGGEGVIHMVSQIEVSNNPGSVGTGGNLVTIANHSATVWLVTAEGDVYRDGSVYTFDAYNDVSLVRAFDMERAPDKIVKNKFDEWVNVNRHDLIELGILTDGGFYNESQLLRLHNGAIYQVAVALQGLIDELRGLGVDIMSNVFPKQEE